MLLCILEVSSQFIFCVIMCFFFLPIFNPEVVIFIFFQQMLTLIEDRLARKVFDDALEVAWSTMWNVTDETAINCQRFLDGRGMEFFLGCLSVSLLYFSHLRERKVVDSVYISYSKFRKSIIAEID